VPELRLEATDFTGASEWRWVLTEDAAILADHEVRLDPSSSLYEAFTDLDFYSSWHAAPDRQAFDEARIAAELGDWIGAEVFGPAITSALTNARSRGHVTVQAVVPRQLALRPLELARIDGKSLAQHDITLVMAPHGADAAIAKPAGERLRVLGLFSLPEGGTALNLRRERHELVRLVGGIGTADITVLQYGVTRARLRDALEDGDGWDIIHISGHGAPGSLLLETSSGRPDRITAAGLADLLDLARGRAKLVTLASCQSASDQTHDYSERTLLAPPSPPASLATELAQSLGCAVLAMRFGVTDEFTAALTEKLYDLLLKKGRDLPSALAIALRQLGGDESYPALSVAAPALFGASAAGLTLKAPPQTGPRTYSTAELKMAGFPPEPDRFVGRVGVMARASAALAPASGVPGVLLHGMPGGGKTACALELAYGHEHAFDQLIWFKAPDEGAAIDGSLTDFALTLERYLDGFQMAHLVSDSGKLANFLPRLTELLKRNRLLIVIDNAESLMSDGGQWRDSLWGQVVAALTAHNGLGCLVLTSRRAPTEKSGVLARESVDVLSPGEALLLARELPNLRQLPSGDLADVLRAAGGHPKLLELANGQAADSEQLAALIESEDAPSSTGDYLRVLAAWTNTVTDALSPGERDLFWFLCCLEEPDRIRPVLDANWDALWQRLGRDGNPPALNQALTAVAARGLAALRKDTADENESYPIHPGVAAGGRHHAGQDFQGAVDTEAAVFWEEMYRRARGEIGDGTVHTALLVRAGLAAVPYLTRLQLWDIAALRLHNAFVYDPTRANAATMLPAIQHITRHDPRQAHTLAQVLLVFDPVAGEKQLRACMDDAAARGDLAAAALAADQLADLCLKTGRLSEAIALADQATAYTRQSGLGPWTQLHGEAHRLYVLIAMGHASQVLDDVQRLRDRMDALPSDSGYNEAVPPWSAREGLLSTGCHAALRLGRWQEALDLNAAQIASVRERRAPAVVIAKTRFSDYGPLIQLGRIDDAFDLLLDCRQAFRDARDTEMLGKALSALAHLERQRGHSDTAVRLLYDALRYQYLAEDVISIAGSYRNLGIFLGRAGEPASALAFSLTGALIPTFTGLAFGTDDPFRVTVLVVLRVFGTAAEPPADIADLCRKLGDIPGTDPAALIARLSPDPETAERTLQAIITEAQALAREPEQET
jgi:tetratricopeptide (TPR) repeat protein